MSPPTATRPPRTKEQQAQTKAQQKLLDELDSVTGPFYVIMTVDGAISGGFSSKRVRAFLGDRLNEMGLREGDDPVSLQYDEPGAGLRFQFEVFADPEHGGHVVRGYR